MEIFDCNKFIELPKLKDAYKAQIDTKYTKKIIVKGAFVSKSEDCRVSKYWLTTYRNEYKWDPNSAEISFGYMIHIPKTELQVVAQVGT